MDSNAESDNEVNAHPEWLKRFLDECEREGTTFALMGSRMLKQKARYMVWYISEKFSCHKHGVPGQASRIVEWFIVFIIRNQPELEETAARRVVMQYIRPRMLLIVACSVMLAGKMNSAMLPVTARRTRSLLALEGYFFSLQEVVGMELDILAAIDFRVPLTTCVETGEMLAHELAVESNVLPVVAKMIDLAELYRYDIEKVLRWVASSRGLDNCDTRVRTLHLAAGGVAAAVKAASNLNGVSQKLAAMLQLPIQYINCIRDVILAEAAKVRPPQEQPLAVLQRKRKINDEADFRPRSPRPGTSRDAL